jgi:hypothetical protein
MLGKGTDLGCPNVNGEPTAACLCDNPDFGYGIRDCAMESCPIGANISQIISYGITYCDKGLFLFCRRPIAAFCLLVLTCSSLALQAPAPNASASASAASTSVIPAITALTATVAMTTTTVTNSSTAAPSINGSLTWTIKGTPVTVVPVVTTVSFGNFSAATQTYFSTVTSSASFGNGSKGWNSSTTSTSGKTSSTKPTGGSQATSTSSAGAALATIVGGGLAAIAGVAAIMAL